jgi:nitrate reductase NapAB chaperone NapD
MPICNYLVFPNYGAIESLSERLSAMPGCDVSRAPNRDILILVTDTATAAAEAELRHALKECEGIRAIVPIFGEVEFGDRPTSATH